MWKCENVEMDEWMTKKLNLEILISDVKELYKDRVAESYPEQIVFYHQYHGIGAGFNLQPAYYVVGG